MTVELTNGEKRHHPDCFAVAHHGVLVITHQRYNDRQWVASYPLTSVTRWGP